MARVAEGTVDVDNDAALRTASGAGNGAAVAALLAAGADVHAHDDDALCWACEGGHAAVVRLLLAAGANVHVRNGMPLRIATANGYTEVAALLIIAARNGPADMQPTAGSAATAVAIEAAGERAHFANVNVHDRLRPGSLGERQLRRTLGRWTTRPAPPPWTRPPAAADGGDDRAEARDPAQPTAAVTVPRTPPLNFTNLMDRVSLQPPPPLLRAELELEGYASPYNAIKGRWPRDSRPPPVTARDDEDDSDEDNSSSEKTMDGDDAIFTTACANGELANVKPLLARASRSVRNRALQLASRNGHREVVVWLLASGVDARAKDDSALRWASLNGHISVVEALLYFGGPGDRLTPRKDEALCSASMNGHLSLVAHLLAVHGADANARGGAALRDASANGHLTVVECLLAAGARSNSGSGDAALCAASANGHQPIVERLLATYTASGRERGVSPEGCTRALLQASRDGLAAVATHLLSLGADARADNDYALRWASLNGHLGVVELLLNAGADLHTRDDEAVWWASAKGHLPVVELLLARGANVHGHSDFALRDASANGHLPVVERLLAAGADLHAKGDEALCAASAKGHLAIVDRLLTAGADVHARSDDALCTASEGGHARVVKRLLAAGANVHARSDHPLRLASKHRHVTTVGILLDAGANVHANNDEALATVAASFRATHWWDTAAPRLLAAGANPQRLPVNWADDVGIRLGLLVCIPKASVGALPPAAVPHWRRLHIRVRLRLAGLLRQARLRLDRPPKALLGSLAEPTRAEMIAHLQTAGRVFAREYWAEGLPLFFPGLDLGALPPEFAAAEDRYMY